MTKAKKFKRRVRSRMTKTGESYVTARSHLDVRSTNRSPSSRQSDWVPGIGYVPIGDDGYPVQASPFETNPDLLSWLTEYNHSFSVGRIGGHPEAVAALAEDEAATGLLEVMKGISASPYDEVIQYGDVKSLIDVLQAATRQEGAETHSFDDVRDRQIGFVDVSTRIFHCVHLTTLATRTWGVMSGVKQRIIAEFIKTEEGRAKLFGGPNPWYVPFIIEHDEEPPPAEWMNVAIDDLSALWDIPENERKGFMDGAVDQEGLDYVMNTFVSSSS